MKEAKYLKNLLVNLCVIKLKDNRRFKQYGNRTNEQTKSALQEVRDSLNESGVFYIATIDGDQPRVRPFGVAEIYNAGEGR